MPEQATPPFSISDAIEKLRANPEIISMVASALSGSAPQKGDDVTSANDDIGAQDTEKERNDVPVSAVSKGDLISSLAPLLSSMNTGTGKSISQKEHSSRRSDRETLLYALKPYVNKNRQTAIEYVIRISQISEMLKGFN